MMRLTRTILIAALIIGATSSVLDWLGQRYQAELWRRSDSPPDALLVQFTTGINLPAAQAADWITEFLSRSVDFVGSSSVRVGFIRRVAFFVLVTTWWTWLLSWLPHVKSRSDSLLFDWTSIIICFISGAYCGYEIRNVGNLQYFFVWRDRWGIVNAMTASGALLWCLTAIWCVALILVGFYRSLLLGRNRAHEP